MASPMPHRRWDESRIPSSTDNDHVSSPARPALATMSSNVKIATPVREPFQKTPAGSPLKRSFTTAMEQADGLVYLKRRKLGDEEVLSQVSQGLSSMLPSSMGTNAGDGLGELLIGQHKKERDELPEFQLELAAPEIVAMSPTEPNTPSEKDDDMQDTLAEARSFSSLINYDPSSQATTSLFKVSSAAQMLRLRLRVAMYKVRTNQVNASFADLDAKERSRVMSKQDAIEQAVAQLRREAQEIASRPARTLPKLLPGPVLRPTAYSSRMLYGTPPSTRASSFHSPERPSETHAALTPLRATAQMSSPANREKDSHSREQELTSSVVKGRVAEGLLGLRHAI